MQLRFDVKRLAAVLAVSVAAVAPFACSSGPGAPVPPLPNDECHAAFGTETVSPSGALEGANAGNVTCGGGGGGGGGLQCKALELAPACVSCVKSQCGSTITRCLGSSWATGKFGGSCAAFAACACPCKDTACLQACSGTATEDCKDCLDEVEVCLDGPCEDACSQAAPTDSGTTDSIITVDTSVSDAIATDAFPFDTATEAGDTSVGASCWFIEQSFPGSGCKSCVSGICSAPTASCLGSNWQQSAFTGGTCDAFLTCVCKCSPSDTTCQMACNGSLTSACSSCFNTVSTCREMNCSGSC